MVDADTTFRLKRTNHLDPKERLVKSAPYRESYAYVVDLASFFSRSTVVAGWQPRWNHGYFGRRFYHLKDLGPSNGRV